MWLIIAIIAYFFLGLGNVFDKILVSKHISSPLAYAFYVGILNIAALVLIPLGVTVPSVFNLFLCLLSGIFFIAALYYLYSALKSGETSTVTPLVYGSTPVYLLVLSFIFLGERLTVYEIIAFALLIIGLVTIAYQKQRRGLIKTILIWLKIYDYKKPLYQAILAGLFFALMNLSLKAIYQNLGFVSGLFWSRMAAVLTALIVLIFIASLRQQIFKGKKEKRTAGKIKLFFVGNQVLAMLGFVGVNYAISLASATIVTALQGLQYVFVFILVAVLGTKIPDLKEKWTIKIITQKLIATILIIVGLYFLNL